MLPSSYNDKVACLASQHHASEYNRAKFGATGCSQHYYPLSIYAPAQFKDLRLRQESYGPFEPWWTCVRDATTPLKHDDKEKLQLELSAAMEAPLEPNSASECSLPLQKQNSANPPIKTSSSHPINVSSLIPAELVPLISSHMVLASSGTGVPILELPSQFHLHRLVNLPPTPQLGHFGAPLSSASTNEQIQSATAHIRTRSSVSQAMHAAITTRLGIYAPLSTHSIHSVFPSSPLQSARTLHEAKSSRDGDASAVLYHHANDSAVSLSLSVSINVESSLDVDLNLYERSPSKILSNKPEEAIDCPMVVPPLETLGKPCSLASTPALSRTSSMGSDGPFTLGNLLMSSCPGKKVRLQGPTRGRAGVCRDLTADLTRIYSLGVRCIICCLDDEELKYLGAPWPQYVEAAHALGLDVLRIPIPEGLAPLDPPSLDKVITEVIEKYTLNGNSALVHCRGGVGRAGVIACSWVAKLGLCGWMNDRAEASEESSKTKYIATEAWGGGLETLAFVEKIVGFVRQRRSLKAVETYEQVSFLVQYVDFLQRGFGARISSAS